MLRMKGAILKQYTPAQILTSTDEPKNGWWRRGHNFTCLERRVSISPLALISNNLFNSNAVGDSIV